MAPIYEQRRDWENVASGSWRKIARACAMAWKVYVQKSLGHPGFVTNPYPLYRWLRNHCPVRRDPIAPVWVLTRYEDVHNLLRDPRFKKDPFAPRRGPGPAPGPTPGPTLEQLDEVRGPDTPLVSMLFLDPPAHTRVRGVFSRTFTPSSLASLRPRIELICRKRLDRVEHAGRMDLIADLAYPLPVIVIAELLGFPPEDYEKFKRWSDDLTAVLALNATDSQRDQAGQTREELWTYFLDVVKELKRRPTDSLLSRLLETEGWREGLNRPEIFINSVLLLAAGHETTTNLIGNGVMALMDHRPQWEELVADSALIEPAVEEMLRFDCPVQWTSRVAGETIEMGGQRISPGDIMLGSLGGANRDPAQFPDPDRFDLHRKDIKHLAFGAGVHFCLGAALARMEAQIALAQLITRFPTLRPEGGRRKWIKGLTFRGVTALPLAWKI